MLESLRVLERRAEEKAKARPALQSFAPAPERPARSPLAPPDNAPREPVRSEPSLPRYSDEMRARLEKTNAEGSAVEAMLNKAAKEEMTKRPKDDFTSSPVDDDPLGLKDRAMPDTKQLTDKEYQGLTPRQQAAVDFNTLLVKAVQADLKGAKAGKRDAQYEKSVDALTAGSDWDSASTSSTYAPNTVKLLSTIGVQDSDATLDDFLGLKVGINSDELGLIDTPEIDLGTDWGTTAGATERRVELQKTLARQFEEKLSKDGGIGDLIVQRNNLVGLPDLPGFGNGPEDGLFKAGFDLISRAGSAEKKGELFQALQEGFKTPETFAKFWQYVDVRSQDALQKKQQLGDRKDATYYDPAEFRKIYLGGA